MQKRTINIHGVFMSLYNVGTLITGAHGIGKSDLALSLLNRGHQLVADDVPEFYIHQQGNIVGKSPANIQDFLAVTALGIINVRKVFGEDAVKPHANLELILNLNDEKKVTSEQRLFGCYQEEIVLDKNIPKITISIKHTQNLADTTECAIKLWQLQRQKYQASNQFIQNTTP